MLPVPGSLTNHLGSEEVQNVVYRICDRVAAAPGIQQSDGFWVCGYIFNHQGSGVSSIDELPAAAESIVDQNLPREGLSERCAAGALVVVCDAHRRVQPGDGAAGQTRRAATLFDLLIEGSHNRLRGNRSNLKDGAVGSDHTCTTLAIPASTLVTLSDFMPDKVATFCALLALHPTSINPGWMTGSPACATRLLP